MNNESDRTSEEIQDGHAEPVDPGAGSGGQDEFVRQCVCFEVGFDTLLDLHESSGAGMMEFYQRFGCGSRCAICMPYILLMLRKHRAELEVHWTQDFLDEGIHPGKVAVIEKQLISRGELPPTGAGKHPLETPGTG